MPEVGELQSQMAAHGATMVAVQESLHRVDRALDKIGTATESTARLLVAQSARADGQDLRMLSFRESVENHIKDDVVAFRRVDDKVETVKEYVKGQLDKQTEALMEKIDNISQTGLKWQGAVSLAAWAIAIAVAVFAHKVW